MTARFIQLDPDFLRLIRPRDPSLLPMLTDPAAARTACALGWGMIDGAYAIGAGGVLPQWKGRAIAWLAQSIHARPRHLARAATFARDWFDTLQATDEFRRIEATVMVGDNRHCLFLERLGFDFPELLRKYGPDGSDHILYARVA